MTAQVFWSVFYSSQQPSQIGPTADFDGAAIPPTIFSMAAIFEIQYFWLRKKDWETVKLSKL